MLKFFKSRGSAEENDNLLQEMQKLNGSVLSLLVQNQQLLEQKNNS